MSIGTRRRFALLLLTSVWALPPSDSSWSVDGLCSADEVEAPSSSVRSPGPDVSTSTPSPSTEAPSSDKPKLRQREGAKLTDRRGRFERRGERYVFLSEQPVAQFLVLENLMLERVANVLVDAAGGQLRWSVTGTITEFHGSNYLQLDRAVVKASQDDDEPRRLPEPEGRTTARPLPAGQSAAERR